jgi:hypothetical protein
MHYVLAMRSWVYHYPHNEQFSIILSYYAHNEASYYPHNEASYYHHNEVSYYPHNEQFRIRPIKTTNSFVLSSQ